MHTYKLAIATAIAACTTGCNALLGVEEVALQRPDAGIAAPVPDAAPSCGVQANIDLVASNPATSSLGRNRQGGPNMVILLNTDAKPDGFGLLLFDNMGGHGALNAPGRYSLTASDARVETCGICVLIQADFDLEAGMASQTFLALGQGTLDVTIADDVRFSGRMQDLRLRRVDLSGETTRDINDGCFVSIADVQFDMMYPPPSPGVAARSIGLGPDPQTVAGAQGSLAAALRGD